MSKNHKKTKKEPNTDSDKKLEPFKIIYDELMEEIHPSRKQIIERCEKLIDDSEGILAGIRIIGFVDHNDCFVFQSANNTLCHSMLTCLGNDYAKKVDLSVTTDEEHGIVLCGECQKKAKASQEESETDDDVGFPGLES
jgi:hypothetical protein